MRAYLATTPKQIDELLNSGKATFDEYLTPDQFDFPAEVGEEEREDLIAQLTAEDSIELNHGKGSFVLAADLSDSQITADKLILEFSQVAALLVGEELAWFSPEEIRYEMENWQGL